MPLINLAAPPTRLDRPSFIIAWDELPDQFQLQCAARQLRHTADPEFKDIRSFCNPRGRAVGSTEETIFLDVNLSFGDPASATLAGVFNTLDPLRGQLKTFAIRYQGSSPTALDNPEFSGQFYIPPIPFADAEPEDYSQITLEFPVFGDIVKAYTPAAEVTPLHA